MRTEYDVAVMGGGTAGAMAALSARTGVDPESLPLADVRALLRRHGAVVPERPAR